jgi:subtilisin-like proprotein convertase family protein
VISRMPASSHRRLRFAAVIALALCTALAMTLTGVAEAKKKKAGPSVLQQSVPVNAAIPDAPASGQSTPINSTITVGKKFKGKVVGDVNVTLQTTGSANGALADLTFRLIAPDGRSLRLNKSGRLGGASIGPLTLDDDSLVSLCYPGPSCTYASETLNPPYVGTANLQFLGTGGPGPLSFLNGAPMRGTWTFQVWDDSNGLTSVLNGWGLRVTAARQVK